MQSSRTAGTDSASRRASMIQCRSGCRRPGALDGGFPSSTRLEVKSTLLVQSGQDDTPNSNRSQAHRYSFSWHTSPVLSKLKSRGPIDLGLSTQSAHSTGRPASSGGHSTPLPTRAAASLANTSTGTTARGSLIDLFYRQPHSLRGVTCSRVCCKLIQLHI